MDRIQASMKLVPNEYKQSIAETCEMNYRDIIDDFNQEALGLIGCLESLARKYGMYKESNIAHNTALLKKVIGINTELPILKFSGMAMEHAHMIFARNEEYFQHLDIPEGELGTGSSFTLIKPEVFKAIATMMTPEEKEPIFDHVTMMAIYSCASFVKNSQ